MVKNFVTLFLSISATVASLKITRRPLLAPFGDSVIPNVQAHGKIHKVVHNSSASEVAASKLVWFLGSSIDQHAVKDTCAHANAITFGDEVRHFFCQFDGLTLVYTFHPGASSPPYYAGSGFGQIHTTTQETMISRLQEMKQVFGKFPDATIVESSIWDVANWWQNGGEPAANQWTTPHQQINIWCHQTIPAFLDLVQKANPHGRIAFRTPPPAFDNSWRGWTHVIDSSTHEMSTCARKSLGNAVNLSPGGKHALIDYREVVASAGKALGGTLRDWYRDDIHPGPELGVASVNAALKWVNGV